MIYAQYLQGLVLRGKTGRKSKTNGYCYYSLVCRYCSVIFEATIYQVKPKTGRKNGKDHCGCQSSIRRATRTGVSPSNKLDDKTRTVRALIQNYKSSARNRSIAFDLQEHDVEALIFKDCYYCGAPPKHKRPIGQGEWKRTGLASNGIDRLDSARGYTQTNVVPCCTVCNYFKVDMSKEEFLDRIKMIYENLNLQDMLCLDQISSLYIRVI